MTFANISISIGCQVSHRLDEQSNFFACPCSFTVRFNRPALFKRQEGGLYCVSWIQLTSFTTVGSRSFTQLFRGWVVLSHNLSSYPVISGIHPLNNLGLVMNSASETLCDVNRERQDLIKFLYMATLSKPKWQVSFQLISLSSPHRFLLSDEVHVFPENDRMSHPEDTVHMQELKRLHLNEDHRRPHYRYPQRKKTPTFHFSN